MGTTLEQARQLMQGVAADLRALQSELATSPATPPRGRPPVAREAYTMEQLTDEERAALRPPSRLRNLAQRTCASCALGWYVEGSFECQRPGGPVWDVSEKAEYEHVCSRHADAL